MNLLLIMRADLFNIIILIGLFIYYIYCHRLNASQNLFGKMLFAAFGHTLFGLMTEYAVNTKNIPIQINNICHIIFYLYFYEQNIEKILAL